MSIQEELRSVYSVIGPCYDTVDEIKPVTLEAANVIDGLVEALSDCNIRMFNAAREEHELTKHTQGSEDLYLERLQAYRQNVSLLASTKCEEKS